MKRLFGVLLFSLCLSSILWSQARQAVRTAPAPARDIDDAAEQLVQLNAIQASMVDSNRRMGESTSGLNAKIGEVCALRKKITAADAAKAVTELCDLSAQSQRQLLALQTQMQNDSRRFTLVSNIMKTKHDTVKNSISNVR
jgi:hypothetical protein